MTVGLLATCNAGKTWIGVASSTDASAAQGHGRRRRRGQKPRRRGRTGRRRRGRGASATTEIQRPLDFQRAMLDRKPGETIRLTVRRSGKPLTLNLTLGELPETAQPGGSAGLGAAGRGTEAHPVRRVPQAAIRPAIAAVWPSRRFAPTAPPPTKALRRGDVLVGMHIWETTTLDNVAYILKRPDFADLSPVKFFILRGDETLYGYLPVGRRQDGPAIAAVDPHTPCAERRGLQTFSRGLLLRPVAELSVISYAD